MKKTKFVVGSLLLVGAFAALVASSMKSNTLQSLPVHVVRAADGTSKSYDGRRLRLVGFVTHDPIRRTTVPSPAGSVQVAHFVVTDQGQSVQVSYRDALPDTFRLGGPVQVDGLYHSSGSIEADHVLTKCPSRYDQLAPAAKKTGPSSGAPPKSAEAIRPHHTVS